ncbi:MAG: GxxExxY protein [Planctomycetaceae bacterium]
MTLRKFGYDVEQQLPISVVYEGELVGEYFADLLVADKVIVELKSARSIDSAHEAQLLNYLKATGREVGLLLNFGEKPEFSRKVFGNLKT